MSAKRYPVVIEPTGDGLFEFRASSGPAGELTLS
jgi:hypothetical protein